MRGPGPGRRPGRWRAGRAAKSSRNRTPSARSTAAADPHSLDWLQCYDVEAAVAYARSRLQGRIVLFGYSLGAALAVEVGSRDRAVSAVVEDSGFDSAVDVFGANFARRTGLPAQPFALAPYFAHGDK